MAQNTLLILILVLCLMGLSDPMVNENLIETDRCTAIIVGPKASIGGSMTTHTSDCSNCDFRLSKIPARDWPEGSLRPLYLLKYSYPATVSYIRGDAWLPQDLEGTPEQLKAWGNESVITGYIPQVSYIISTVLELNKDQAHMIPMMHRKFHMRFMTTFRD